MNTDADQGFLCVQCRQDWDRFPGRRLYVEWSNQETIEDPAIRAEFEREGCVAEMFCSWGCAARWFHSQADLHPQQC
jgi:hypothetical protein